MSHPIRALRTAAAGVLACAVGACAHAPAPASAAPAAPAERTEVVTGSHIRQEVEAGKVAPPTTSPTRIYSSEDLQRTGRPDVAGAVQASDPRVNVAPPGR